jgi:Fe-Mn family superoxide dismutase
VDFASTSNFAINGLKREEVIAYNSMVLHEIYFSGLAGDARSPGSRLGQQIERDFGSLDRWSTEFSAMGKAMDGGSGWVLLNWSPRLGKLVNTWAADHTITAADGSVILALDMYEHAYTIDYGARAGTYVDAFMAAMRWTNAGRVFATATGGRS